MGPAVFVLAILGCGEADSACRQVAVADGLYRSVQACTDATATVLEKYQDLAFPVVVAQCQPAGTKVSVELRPDEIDLPEPEKPARGAPRVRFADRRAGV